MIDDRCCAAAGCGVIDVVGLALVVCGRTVHAFGWWHDIIMTVTSQNTCVTFEK